jgi:predicted site-specific integrase-resolvase
MPHTHFNQADLAARLNISPRTLERWRWTGEVPAFLKIRGRAVYRHEDIVAFENARRCKNTTQTVLLRAAQ